MGERIWEEDLLPRWGRKKEGGWWRGRGEEYSPTPSRVGALRVAVDPGDGGGLRGRPMGAARHVRARTKDPVGGRKGGDC